MTENRRDDAASEHEIAPLPPLHDDEPLEGEFVDERDVPPGAFDDERADERVAPLPPRVDRGPGADPEAARSAMDKYLAIQRPVVLYRIRQLRRRYPDATPAELQRKIELQYLNTVTATGGGAGVAAVVPGVGTAASLAVSGAETIGFLEMTALYGQAVAELHGLAVSDPVRARTLVQSLMVGGAAKEIIEQFTGQVMGRGRDQQAFWGEMVTRSLPRALMGDVAARIRDAFIKRFAANTAGRTVGRLVPFGIGAVIGGAGNRLLARRVIETAHEAFGPAPSTFPLDLHPDAEVRGEPVRRKQLGRGGGFFFGLPRRATMGELEAAPDDRA